MIVCWHTFPLFFGFVVSATTSSGFHVVNMTCFRDIPCYMPCESPTHGSSLDQKFLRNKIESASYPPEQKYSPVKWYNQHGSLDDSFDENPMYRIRRNKNYTMELVDPVHEKGKFLECRNLTDNQQQTIVRYIVQLSDKFVSFINHPIASSAPVKPGFTIRLNCSVVGNPLPEITWIKNNIPLQLDHRIIIDPKRSGLIKTFQNGSSHIISELLLQSTVSTDSGKYGCSAKSDDLQVYSDVVNVVIQKEANVKVKDLRAHRIGPDSAILEWIPPQSVTPLNAYVIRYGTISIPLDPGQKRLLLKNLTPNTKYNVSVQPVTILPGLETFVTFETSGLDGKRDITHDQLMEDEEDHNPRTDSPHHNDDDDDDFSNKIFRPPKYNPSGTSQDERKFSQEVLPKELVTSSPGSSLFACSTPSNTKSKADDSLNVTTILLVALPCLGGIFLVTIVILVILIRRTYQKPKTPIVSLVVPIENRPPLITPLLPDDVEMQRISNGMVNQNMNSTLYPLLPNSDEKLANGR